ncbi:MAG: hypothetical protein P8Y58_12725 [Novosphingobium sp.]
MASHDSFEGSPVDCLLEQLTKRSESGQAGFGRISRITAMSALVAHTEALNDRACASRGETGRNLWGFWIRADLCGRPDAVWTLYALAQRSRSMAAISTGSEKTT